MVEQAAVVFGAGGGIGAALVAALCEEGGYAAVHALTRADCDVTDEASIMAAVARIAAGPPMTLAIVATGLLHDGAAGPEKATAQLEPVWLARNFAVNAIAPALVAKHLLPVMPKAGRTVFAALSARIGSISDNALGGWHSYRASKAALNQLIRTIAIEERRRNPQAVVVALHPGTVATRLSEPFRGNVQPGRLFSPERAAGQLLDVIDELRPPDSGWLFDWDGKRVAP